jgi:hypothetical protein
MEIFAALWIIAFIGVPAVLMVWVIWCMVK